MGYGHDKDLAVASYCSGCGQNVSLLLIKGSLFSHIHASSEVLPESEAVRSGPVAVTGGMSS